MADLKSFSKHIRIQAHNVEKVAEGAVKEASSAILKELIENTPVDTGQAISNWQVGIGSTPSSVLKPYSIGSGGSTASVNRLAALNQGETIIKGYKKGRSINIVNNLDYIEALDTGHSKQAPAGFVGLAVLAGRRAIQNISISFLKGKR